MHSALLWFGAAAVVPIIIHLLARRRAQTVRFAAVRFIRRSGRSGVRKTNVKHLILMLLRMALVLLMVLIVARPVVRREASGATPAAGAARSIVLIVDDSLSMNYRARGSSWFEAARNKALQALGAIDGRASVAFLTTSRPQGTLSRRHEAIRGRLKGVRATLEAHPCWAALQTAAELLRGTGDAAGEIVLYTDMTRSAWHGLERRRLELGEGVRLHVVDVSEGDAANLAVSDIRHVGEPAVEGAVLTLEAEMMSVGEDAEALCEFEFDGELVDRQGVQLAAGGRQTATFRTPLVRGGHHWGRVSLLDSDALPFDDGRTFTLEAAGPLSVLCVADDAAEGADSSAYFFRSALRPWSDPQRGMFRLEGAAAAQLADLSLADYDLVVLVDTAGLEQKSWQRLSAFVSGGGGLLVFCGANSEPDGFSAPAARELLPALPGPVVAAENGEVLRLRVLQREHPLAKGFADAGIDLGRAHFRHCRELTVAPEGLALLSFGPGLPALVLKEGGGKVAVFASGADGRWGNFPKLPDFPPFCHELAFYLKGDPGGRLKAFSVGESVPIRFATSQWPTRVTVLPPAEQAPREIMPGATPGQRVFWDTDRPGYYSVAFEQKDEQWQSGFAVNVAAVESDLNKVPAEDVRSAIEAAEVTFAGDVPSAGGLGDGHRRIELTPYLALLAIVACFVESFLSNRFHRARGSE